ncbi:MAG TPA: hypothetical protein VHY84_22170 [Bryobacteraceae bacterium]|jgi:hypothetical protein|nr:hypothetical protein [Bryobacteraceae bacterium]
MNSLLENAQRIFEVARAAGNQVGEYEVQDFALLVQPSGALHFVMDAPFSIEAAAIDSGAQTAFRITRSRDGVRVQGKSTDRGVLKECLLEERNPGRALFRDQPRYCIVSPLLTSSAPTS